MGLMGQTGQAAQAVGVDENSKRAAQELTKLLGKVNQYRQKFNSSILKNSEAMNGYHDLVLNAVQMYQQTQNMLGPFGQQLVRQIHDAVGNLVYDLKSEQEQIDTFLKQLKDAGMAKVDSKSVGGKAMIKGPNSNAAMMDPTLLGAAAKKRAQASRVEENPGSSVSSARRNAPAGGAKLGKNMAKNAADNAFEDERQSDIQKLYQQAVEGKKKKSGKK
jgi:hypothetical protein